MFYLRHLKSVRSGKTPFLLKSVLSLTILLLTVVVLQSMLKLRSQASRLKSDTCESSDFRQQYLPPGKASGWVKAKQNPCGGKIIWKSY